jgi:hypothetical protein
MMDGAKSGSCRANELLAININEHEIMDGLN